MLCAGICICSALAIKLCWRCTRAITASCAMCCCCGLTRIYHFAHQPEPLSSILRSCLTIFPFNWWFKRLSMQQQASILVNPSTVKANLPSRARASGRQRSSGCETYSELKLVISISPKVAKNFLLMNAESRLKLLGAQFLACQAQ